MRICIIGHHVQRPDEGVRNVTSHLMRELTKNHDTVAVDIKRVSDWPKVRSSHPSILHFLVGPSSLSSLMIVKLLSFSYPAAKTVVSALQPLHRTAKGWGLLFGPDLVLAQSSAARQMYEETGWRCELFPNGVDTGKFAPVSNAEREQLRSRYRIPKGRYVVLHVGSVSYGRNVQLLQSLQGNGCQVLIAGRALEKPDRELMAQLRRSGCIVWNEFLPHIEEVYSLSDCYVFPVLDKRHSIDMPLSVLEAMACNLPVVTTPFGGLPDHLADVAGLRFALDEAQIQSAVMKFMRRKSTVRTRTHALGYSWFTLSRKLEDIYEELVS